MLFLILKALHIIAAVFWFAGLLYLPRLFVYHADCDEAAGRARFALMERRLYWRIMQAAMAATLGLGLVLMGVGGALGGWLAVKLLLVLLLLVFHVSLFFYMKKLAAGQGVHPSGRFFRLYNEIPALLLIGIVCLAVLKPF